MLYQTELYPARGFHSVTETPLKGQGQAIDAKRKTAFTEAMFDLTRRWPIELHRNNALFLVLAVASLLAVLYQIDVATSLWAQSWPQPIRDFFWAITDIGKSDWMLIPTLVVAIVGGIAWLVMPKGAGKLAAGEAAVLSGYIFLGIGLPGLAANLLKRLVGRGRPEVYADGGALDLQHFFNDSVYQSFPSGHTTTIFALCFTLSFLVPRLFPWLLAVSVAVGLSRIVIGVHYPTDVFAGFLVGTFGAYAVRNVFAARGWLFTHRLDGRVVLKSLTGLPALLQRRS